MIQQVTFKDICKIKLRFLHPKYNCRGYKDLGRCLTDVQDANDYFRSSHCECTLRSYKIPFPVISKCSTDTISLTPSIFS